MALGVTNDDDGLESGSLTGTGLLLHRLDLEGLLEENLTQETKYALLHHLILQLGQEPVDNLVLLHEDRIRKSVAVFRYLW